MREIRQTANTMSLLGWHPTILTLRLLALIGLVLSMIGIWLLSSSIQIQAGKSPESAIRLRYGSMLIETQSVGKNESSHMVDVQSIEDLAKLAERYNTVILHENNNDSHSYFANTEGTTYRFVIDTKTEIPK